MKRIWTACVMLACMLQAGAQDVSQIQFCDKQYEYGLGKDSITLFLKVLDNEGKPNTEITVNDLDKYLVVNEEGVLISPDRRKITSLSSGQRIPSDYTFSVLVDLSIPEEGKGQIFKAFGQLVESAPDSCVFLSFFGDEVTASQLVTKKNLPDFEPKFKAQSENKFFYGALYSKLVEFSSKEAELEGSVTTKAGYTRNETITRRAEKAKDKNILFFFFF